MPFSRKVHESGIRELRVHHGSDYYRIFYFATTDRMFILLHAITKKRDKIPPDDLELALKRRADYLTRNKI
jgi:phage-related protein